MEVVGKKDLLPDTPKHIAIIMDGNGRWAGKRALSRLKGHEQGAKAVREVIKGCCELGIPYLTLFAFSSENWKRPKEEVNHLMGLFKFFFNKEIDELTDAGVKVEFIGTINKLPEDVRKLSEEIVARTAQNTALNLTIALNYGGRSEIVNAARKLAIDIATGKTQDSVSLEDKFESYLQTANTPDPDMIVRTSGEKRISNFLLWQSAYSELIFQDVLWPDYTREDLQAAINEFYSRNRRYGAVSV